MKSTVFSLLLLGLASVSCSQKENPANTEPANYAETRDALIQNHEDDSLKTDSANALVPSDPPASTDSLMKK
ncbi:hypothetical protein [Kaistella palustris]|uniref:hypothetical protein n=1 Tax=Kaistella palustris TaxID=493376 RepID=UPI0004276905|nr:hypothetical protein [Kaistella palustris]